MNDAQQTAADKIKLPAVGIMVVGILGILSGLYSALDVIFGFSASMMEVFDLPSDARQMMAVGSVYGLLSVAINVAGSAFLIWAALQMLKLRGHTLAVVASAIAMIPCWGCCCLGVPVGIWTLVVLLNPEVKAAFDQ